MLSGGRPQILAVKEENMKEQITSLEECELPYAYWLYNIAGVGSKTIVRLLAQVKTPQILYHLPEKELELILKQNRMTPNLAKRIIDAKQHWDVQGTYCRLLERKIKFTCLGHSDYPDRLLQIPDAPYGIYYRGKLPDKNKPTAAIIGARSCSEYGKHMAQRFGREFAMAGMQIISGMARGIDGIGQNAALAAGGYSLGVMGCGVDICYPSENKDLYDLLCTQGGVCSEYPPGTAPRNSLFPPRNRIISGLSDFVLVIEAKHRSGTLITVDMALEQGREVYALPGRVTDALSEGTNRLLQQGAAVALSPQDMIGSLTGQISVQKGSASLLSDRQIDILDNLEDTPQSVEMIKQRMLSNCSRDVPLPELMNELVKLSLNGQARQIGNSYFMRE